MKKNIALSLLASASFLGLNQPAFAQNAPAADDTAAVDEDVIVVTARKREENLIDVPLPVTVATKAQLERDQINNISDMQRITPALEISQTSGGESNGGARLRGLGTGVFNPSVSPSVAFVVDQVSQGNLSFPQLYDLAQVEVLRGPQGTLFGQGASAGVVNVTTVQPSLSRASANGGISFADKGTGGSEVSEMVVNGAFNVPIGNSAALRFATQFKREKGLQRNTFLKLDNKIEDFGMRLSALIEASDAVTINLKGEYSKNTTNGWNFFAVSTTPNALTPVPFIPGTPPVGPVSNGNFLAAAGCNIGVINARAEFYCEDTQAHFENTAGGLSAVVDIDLSDTVTLTSVSSARKITKKTSTVNFSRRIINPAARNENIQNDATQFSEELRLAYDTDSLNLVVGGLYSAFKYEVTPTNFSLGFGNVLLGQRTGFSVCPSSGLGFCPVPLAFTYEKTMNNTLAVFTDATLSLTEQLDVFGGLRYSTYKNTTGVGVNSYNASRTSTIKDDNISGRAGLSYKPSTDSTVYASASLGYKPPALVVPTIAGNPVTKLLPEKATAFEIGAKAALGRLQLSGNIFYTKVKNFQGQDSVFSGAALVSRTFNVPSVKSKGFEVGVFGKLSDNFSINTGYQYNDVKFPTGYLGNDGISLGGTQFVNAPKHKFTLSGEFTLPVTEGTEVFLNANAVYKSKVLLAQYGNPNYRFPSHEIINGGFGFRDADGAWKASLFVRNLTKQREPAAYLAGDFSGIDDGSIRAWPIAGLTARVVGVAADFSF